MAEQMESMPCHFSSKHYSTIVGMLSNYNGISISSRKSKMRSSFFAGFHNKQIKLPKSILV